MRAEIDEQQGRTKVALGIGSRITWLARHPRLTISATLIGLLIAVAILAPWISPYDPNYMDFNLPLSPPSAEHWLGTDQLGRDVLSRLMFGARLSLQISITAVAVATMRNVFHPDRIIRGTASPSTR